MEQRTATALMRLLHGELDEIEAARLRERMEGDPDLQAEFVDLDRLWSGLELPPPEPAPKNLALRVLRRAKADAKGSGVPSWWWKTRAGRLTSAAILMAGIATGVMIRSAATGEDWSEFDVDQSTLAESYLIALQDVGGVSVPEDEP